MATSEAIQKELICPICVDYFTNPKGLPCLHTFCRDCLKSHIMTQADKRHFTCPMCRAAVPTPEDKPRLEWVDIFPSNHHVVSLMDIVVPNYKPVYCKLCTDRGSQRKAVKSCSRCSENYCWDCSRIHNLLNATKSHVLSDMTLLKKQIHISKSESTKNKQSNVEYRINASFKGTINTKSENDDESPFITGITFLEDDRIVVTDNNNYKIKLFDSEGKFVTEASQARPFGITLLHQTTIAITEAGCIKFYEIHPTKIKLEKIYNGEWKIFTPHTINLSSAPRGIHYLNGRFVVCSGDDMNKHIVILDTHGRNPRNIWRNNDSQDSIFKDPWYCRLDDESEDIYVSDGIGIFGCVKCLSDQGKIKWEYPCHMPRGIVTVGEHVIVADWRDDEIKVLSKEGEFIKSLLTKNDGVHRPQALAINHSGDKLIVTNSPPYKSDLLLVFDLEYAKVTESNKATKQTNSTTCNVS